MHAGSQAPDPGGGASIEAEGLPQRNCWELPVRRASFVSRARGIVQHSIGYKYH